MDAISEGQKLARDTIEQKPVKGIGIWLINPMEWRMIDRLAGVPEGTYQRDPIPTYRRMLEESGVCMVDQWIPNNPMTMGNAGYGADKKRGATTGAKEIVCDGISIQEPEDVVRHLESVVFPRLEKDTAVFDEEATVKAMLAKESESQAAIGDQMLKAPYVSPMARLPTLAYGRYGYSCYFMAYALYPEVIEKHFRLQADFALLYNRASVRAFTEGGLPSYLRLDHDMADSRGTLVDIKSLDAIWFPHVARCLEPFAKTDIRLVWHCDGNLSQMVPRLIEAGIRGFQGFQYEDGMDYEKICRMKTREGRDLLIIGGVSVTRTLPHGTPEDVKKEMKWLVEHGPKQGLFLGGSSSIAPGVPWENLKTLVEGFRYYRTHGRK